MKNALIICGMVLATQTTKAQNIFPSTGSVGIGTTSPEADLHVSGKVIIDSTITLYGRLSAGEDVHLRKGLRVQEAATFNSSVLLPGLTPPATTNVSILLHDNTSTAVHKIPAMDFVSHFSQIMYGLSCLSDTLGNVTNPLWQNGTNKLQGWQLCL